VQARVYLGTRTPPPPAAPGPGLRLRLCLCHGCCVRLRRFLCLSLSSSSLLLPPLHSAAACASASAAACACACACACAAASATASASHSAPGTGSGSSGAGPSASSLEPAGSPIPSQPTSRLPVTVRRSTVSQPRRAPAGGGDRHPWAAAWVQLGTPGSPRASSGCSAGAPRRGRARARESGPPLVAGGASGPSGARGRMLSASAPAHSEPSPQDGLSPVPQVLPLGGA